LKIKLFLIKTTKRIVVLSLFWYNKIMNKTDYEKLYSRHAAFYQTHPRGKQALVFCNVLFSVLIALSYIALSAFLLLYKTPTRGDFLRVLGAPALCVTIATALQFIIRRPRPYVATNIQPLIQKSAKGRSFPSRHLSSAFVIAMLFAAYQPLLCVPVFFLGAMLGYIRFAVGVHYPTDLLAGAALGALVGCLCFIGL
jgi:membrane-associated phospholipid phosphatase